MADAACRGLDWAEFFPDGSGSRVSPEVKRICVTCPVRADCLEWALTHDEAGYWGGVDEKNRGRLQRHRTRRTCPSCASRALVLRGLGQSCTACGLSWFTVNVHTLEKGEAA